jgi:putative flippase GtrA
MRIYSLILSEKFRYLLAGVWNTIFGYAVGGFGYLLFNQHLHTIWIGIFANIIAISMSFITYKVFVFRTTGNWIAEYLKMYLVYGVNAIIGSILIWILVDIFNINIWLSLGVVWVLVFLTSFFLNRSFTFKSSSGPN